MKAHGALVPWTLGLAGLIPFWALALALLTGHTLGFDPAAVGLALAAYAATIASFLGGIRWGLAVAEAPSSRRTLDFALSVVPQLLAWAALALHEPWRLIGLAMLIAATGPLDLNLARRGLAPAWFGALRLVLSLGAAAALFAATAA